MNKRFALPLVVAWACMTLSGAVIAAPGDFTQIAAASPNKDGANEKGGGKERGAKENPGKEKKKVNKHASGKGALGEKIKQNGKHAVGKFKNRTVTADVQGGKVRTMAADDLQPKRVKTQKKMADAGGTSPLLHLAQYGGWYYGYCFDDGYDLECYWYPEEEVYWEDYSWDPYDDYYY
jgi:hypothetical protein